ncbi:MAG: MerR family transcriptional regulator [Chloroflexota bacterium]|jgi:methanogenic corrinoid protein MtbC1
MVDPLLSNPQHTPVYNIKAVSRLVGLLPVTLRAWERRYGLPHPLRGDQGYRLYSEYDLRLLQWLKQHVDAGMSIGRAVDYLHELRSMGKDPLASGVAADEPERPASLDALFRQFLTALQSLYADSAAEILRRAFSLYSVDQVLEGIITPALVELGERWHRGELPIAVEHYATQFCMQYLMSLLSASAPPSRPGVVVAACAPGELHQIGLLMLVVMLRWRGWDVKYFGQDLPLDRLEEALRPIRPRLMLFTATRKEAADQLNRLPEVLRGLHDPKPMIVLGGQAFLDHQLPESVPAVYLNGSPAEVVSRIERLLLGEAPSR